MGGEPLLRKAGGSRPALGDGRRPSTFEGCEVWAVLNVTPDSFSDGGRYRSVEDAVAQARRFAALGARVIDVGGESSRPAGKTYGAGAAHVPANEEIARVVPVLEVLAGEGVRLSVDTVKPEVARAAVEAGAAIVNDVSCGASTVLFEVVAEHAVELVLMHSRDGGRVDETTTAYGDIVRDVERELARAIERAVGCGVDPSRIWIDPGLGFAKTASQSRELLARVDELASLGHRVLVGASRKSFLAEACARADGSRPAPGERLGASIAAAIAAAERGATAVRVHDVDETLQAFSLLASLGASR